MKTFLEGNMKVRLEYDKKNNIWLAIIFLAAFALFLLAGYPIWMLFAFTAVFYLIQSMKLELNARFSWLWTGILFLAGSYLSMYSVQYIILDAEQFQKTDADKLFLNMLCCMVVYLILLLFINKTGIACAAAHILLLVLGFTNYFVYLFRQSEFIFSDLFAIRTGLSVAGNYRFVLHERGAYAILAAILFIALALKFEVSFASRVKMTAVVVTLAVGCIVFVWSKTEDLRVEIWEQKGSYKNGYLLNFALTIRDSFVPKPENYSIEALTALEEKYQAAGEAADEGIVQKPVIIAIMNESFADLEVIGDLTTNQPMTPFMDSLEENTIKGYALSSVFGAKTPNSEWEFLSGSTMAFMPKGTIVYQQYLDRSPYSMVSSLQNLGYTCAAMHPYYASGWSRNRVYSDMGFDETYFIEDFHQEEILREYITDQELYRKVIERYEQRKEGEPLFIFAVTMQNHGGYTKDYDNFIEDTYKIGLSYTDVNQYLSLIRESDRALEELVTYFMQVEEPVEIIFFGDHQPSLNRDFYELMNGRGLSGLTLAQLEDLYTVPFFIWTNYDSSKAFVERTSLNYLSLYAWEQSGLPAPPYYQFLSDMRDMVPAINASGYYSNECDAYIHLEDAKNEEDRWLNMYEILQYNSIFGKKNRSSLFFGT